MSAEVRAAVERYIEGVTRADPAIVKDAFLPNAVMWGYLGDRFESLTATEFAEHVVAGSSPTGPEYAAEIHSISVTGDTATAVLDERGYLGADFRDSFGLVRVDGVWRIASKIFTTR